MANGFVPPINDSRALKCTSYITSSVELYGGSDEARWVASGGKEGKAPEYNSILMPYAGFAALRTGWGQNDISAFFDAGKYGRDHFHDDKLNLLIYNSEKVLITECGTYAYDMSKMRNYCVNTEGHNTVMVDGFGQCRFEGHWDNPENWAHTKEEVALIEKQTLDYAFGAYREKYGVCDYSKYKRPAVAGRNLAEHVREVVMMKRPAAGKPYFIAVDTLTDKVGESHTYEALWHINAEGATLEGDKVLSEELTLHTCGFDSLEIVKGREEPWQGWIGGLSNQFEYKAVPTVVAKRCGTAESFATLFEMCPYAESVIEGVALRGTVLTVTYKNGSNDEIDLSELRSEACVKI
jgi:hypothetical protein